MASSLDSGKSYKSPLGSSSTNLRREGRGILFKINLRDFPVVQWLRLHAPSAGGLGLIPG